MIQKNLFAHIFNSAEILDLQSFIGHAIEAAYTHFDDDAHTFSNPKESKIEVSFKAKLLIRFSHGYFIFSNHVLYDKFGEEVCKVILYRTSYKMPPNEDIYTKAWESSLLIDKISIYTAIDQEFDIDKNPQLPFSFELWQKDYKTLNLYSMMSDELLIFENTIGQKVAISAWGFFEGSIRLCTDTNRVERDVILQFSNDRVTPRYYKRIEITKETITHLWDIN